MRTLSIILVLLAACSSTRPDKDLVRLAGVWESSGGFTYTRMRIESDGAVDWHSTGCLDTYGGERRAALRGDSLRLSEPVKEYAIGETDAFQYVLADGREYLVADHELELMRESKDPFDPDVWVGLRRRLPRTVLETRLTLHREPRERERLLEEWSGWPVGLSEVGFLSRFLSKESNEDVRIEAVHILSYAGFDDAGTDVTDPRVRASARAVLERVAREDPSATARNNARASLDE